MGEVENEPIPETRRSHFTRWPKGRLSKRDRRIGRKGIADVREELTHHPAWTPDHDDD